MIKKLFLFAALLGSVALIQIACNKDCTKECGNGIVNVDFCDCSCDAGYEYDADGSCTVETIAKFVAEYRVVEDSFCSIDPAPYIIQVERGAELTELVFKNLYDSGANVTATFSGNNITIARQALGLSFEVDGSGTLGADGNMTMNYYIYLVGDPISSADCTDVIFTRQ